jgi:hypothetical protein
MGKYQFTMLARLSLSNQEAKGAAWYEGAGWYVNPLDADGKALPARCVARSDPADDPLPSSGQLAALNRCGEEGWFVAAFVPTPSESRIRGVFRVFGPDFSPDGPYFILQRQSKA